VLAAAVGVAVIAVAAVWASRPGPSLMVMSLPMVPTLDQPVMEVHPFFYDADAVLPAAAQAKGLPDPRVAGFVVPHHLLGSPLIVRGYEKVRADIDTVYVVGPNHFNAGGAPLTTAAVTWKTAAGELRSETGAVRSLADGLGAAQNAEVFRSEHSVGAQAWFIRRFSPGSQVVPLVLDSYVTRRQAEAVGEWLAARRSPHVLFVFSIDFSHYLPEADARRHDKETRQAIEDGDLDAISRFSNDNVDSPASLIAALAFAKAAGLKVEIAATTNSNEFLMSKENVTTSHFLIYLIDATITQ
jgi:AmmeMemoRadiSam system protein B